MSRLSFDYVTALKRMLAGGVTMALGAASTVALAPLGAVTHAGEAGLVAPAGPVVAVPEEDEPERDMPLVGDWNGNGQATAGVVRDGRRYLLRNRHAAGAADIAFTYGREGDIPIVGDWNGNGVQTIGVLRPVRGGNLFLLRNSNTSGSAEISFRYGRPGDSPIVGDWNGDGVETVGVMRGDRHGNTFFLRNRHRGGQADIRFRFGRVGDRPVAGNWNAHLVDEPGSDIATAGVHRGRTFHLLNSHRGGTADMAITYGRHGDIPLTGNFTGHIHVGGDEESIGVRRGARFLLRAENASGPADFDYVYGR